MNILLITGPIVPKPGNNATLLSKLFPFFSCCHKMQLLSFHAQGAANARLPEYLGIPILSNEKRETVFFKLFMTARAKLIDRNGFSDYVCAKRMEVAADNPLGSFHADVLISTTEPFAAADAAARITCKKKILFIMDPPACISNGQNTPYRNRRLNHILAAQDVILTTPFIRQAFSDNGFDRYINKIIPVGFPMIEFHNNFRTREDDGRIHLLFCGWLYSDIRSPKYFLDILSRLDERFVVTFMGRECEKLKERFNIHTKAELIIMPQQPYETAMQAMADADILINIGNSVPVHMPSKTLEYINTGKPFVNFYKIDDCPTLYYTKRYPLCLNMSEGDPDLDATVQRFVDFCTANKGKTVDRSFIEREYADCTPEYIAQIILDALGE